MGQKIRKCLFIGIVHCIFLQFVACTKATTAPVVEGWLQKSAKKSFYRVKEGDTIYSIAWAFGIDYRELAQHNQLKNPFVIHSGQKLNMTTVVWNGSSPSTKYSKNVLASDRNTLRASHQNVQFSANTNKQWMWRRPAKGKILFFFSPTPLGNHGIDIGGRPGSLICAARSGIVVYSGNGVRGYGNLLIIKHDVHYLSAYAFIQRILVKEGSRVRKGQAIAEMGSDFAGRTVLHFEIRRDGRSVNPLIYLPAAL